MIIKIHPSAAKNYNSKVRELIKLIEEMQPQEDSADSFPSELLANHKISEKDIVDMQLVGGMDYRGNTSIRYFDYKEKLFGLSEENYKQLRTVAEGLQSCSNIRDMLSKNFVEEKIFAWIAEKYKGRETPGSLIDYLEKEAESSVKSFTVWIPIANLEIESEQPISNSKIRPLSSGIIDDWESNMASFTGDTTLKLDEYRKRYQGLACVVTKITAEPEFAFDYALEESQKIMNVLGIFSDAMRIPDIKCISDIIGKDKISSATAILNYYGYNLINTTKPLDYFLIKNWRLSNNDILAIRGAGLDKLSSLLSSNSLNDFESSCLNSIYIYARSAFTSNPIEKVVYTLTALESILLKNNTESIQQNLAERLAIFTVNELKDRKSTIQTIKAAYKIRSGYLHHGHSKDDLDLISKLQKVAQEFFHKLISNVDNYQKKSDFLDAIDDKKLM